MKINLHGASYYVNIKDGDRPLLLLHGFTGRGSNWRPIADRLGADYQCIMPDLLGHGRTAAPPNPERYGMALVAADLIALLDTLQVEQAHLLGYSMGGRLALYMALHYPERVNTLLLESSSPGLVTAKERSERKMRDDALADRIEREGIVQFVDFWEGISLWGSQQMVAIEKRQALRLQRLENRPEGLANSLRGMGAGAQPSLWEQLMSIKLPTLLLAGELDEKFVRLNQQMVSKMPTAVLEIMYRAGHTIHFERPQAYSEKVLAFLRHHL